MRIAGRPVGPGHPVYVIAEAGVNHDGDPAAALELVDAAAQAGACALKVQTFRADRLATPAAPKAPYQLRAGGGDSQLEMLRRLELGEEALRAVSERARARGITFFSSPFDQDSADLLEALDVPAFKLGSGELTHHQLLAHVARKRRPMLLSTGMADLDEVAAAVRVVRESGDPPLILLHCLSAYPAPAEQVNLRALEALRTFGVPVGFSDHTPGWEVALAAVALGACVIEKHLTLDRARPGPDHAASLDPPALASLVRGVRLVESALGDGVKRPAPCEAEVAAVARRSLVATRDLPRGAILQPGDLEPLRPGTGLSPAALPSVLGRRLALDLARGTPLRGEMLA